MMRDQGVKFQPENGQGPEQVERKRKEFVERGFDFSEAKILVPEWDPSTVDTWVAEFPTKSPDGAITRDQVSAIEQLEWYLKIQNNWCEHNQSITIYVRDNEWVKVGAWVYDHFDEIVGVSFLPYDGGTYTLAPYEECTKEEYEKMSKEFPKIDYSQLTKYELEDATTGAQVLACTSGNCEIP
jgi:ribonucleoside-diphosphate reductase alpha chain